jgi:hypothetical protein
VTQALALLFGIVFFELVILLDLRRDVLRIADGSRTSLAMLRSAASDAEKEACMRRESVRLFSATALLTLKFVLLAGAMWLLYELVVMAFPDREAALQASLVSPVGILVLTIATLGYAWARHVVLKKL